MTNPSRIMTVLTMALVAFATGACSGDSHSKLNGRSPEDIEEPPKDCKSDPYQYLNVQKFDGDDWVTLDSKIVRYNPACEKMRSVLTDACGKFISTMAADWTVPPVAGFVRETSAGEEREVCFNRGSVTAEQDHLLTVSSSDQVFDVPLDISWTPTDIPGLKRWYKADALLPFAHGTSVGDPEHSPWVEFGPHTYGGISTSPKRKPQLDTVTFEQPTVRFCGSVTKCEDGAHNSSIRVADNFAPFSETEFTIVVVAARANGNRNYYLANQSQSNKGLFMGWVSNKEFRIGFSGPDGKPNLTVKRPAFSAPPKLEVWSARLNTGSLPSASGLELRLENSILGFDGSIVKPPKGEAQVPFIGSQRNDHNTAHFYMAEWMYYNRALTDDELATLHDYLYGKY